MRCLVRLTAAQDQAYNSAYHVKLQGVLYRLLERAGFDFVHDQFPFKFVTFSNIFPPNKMTEGDQRHWLVASPHEELVEAFADAIWNADTITVGSQKFSVEETSIFNIVPENTGQIETATPIVVRIPASRCETYGIDPEYDDVYWRQDHPKTAFITEVERNLASKYEHYYGDEPPERPYFTDWTPRKEVSVPLHYEDDRVIVIGTTWEIEYECYSKNMYSIVQLAFDAGLGELNTSGFGFVNEY